MPTTKLEMHAVAKWAAQERFE